MFKKNRREFKVTRISDKYSVVNNAVVKENDAVIETTVHKVKNDKELEELIRFNKMGNPRNWMLLQNELVVWA